MEPMEKPRDWPRLRRQIRAAWPKVSDDDLDQAGGDLRVVASLIEERYGRELSSTPPSQASFDLIRVLITAQAVPIADGFGVRKQ